MNRTEAIQQLRQLGWTIEEGAASRFELPPAISARYPRLPEALTEFLSGLSTCTNRDQTAWFLCKHDYCGTSESAFRWDEFEQMSIEAAAADNDKTCRAEIRGFWDIHFPFMLSVQSGYAFYAVCTSPDRFGHVVEGCEPMFEEVSLVARSFPEFLRRFLTESKHERLSPIDLNG